jgi:hypothetical protein
MTTADLTGVPAGGRRPGSGRSRLFATVVCVAALGAGVGAVVAHASSTAGSTSAALPQYLADAGSQADTPLTGSVPDPAVTSQGDVVRVVLPAGTVLASVTGPEVPGEGFPYVAPATTCTWTIRLTGATHRMPIDVADFDSIDSQGTVYRTALVPGQPRPPSSLAPGQTVSFELRAVMNTGEGLMRWAPDGKHIEAKWDFEVEND